MEEKNKEEKNTEKKNAYKDEDIEMKEPEGQKVDKIEEEKKEKERKSPKKEKSISELEKLIDYKYNENGELINKKTGQKCGKLNKQEYDLVGIYVQKYVENLIIKTFDLNILYVPNHNPNPDFLIRDESIPQCKILTTKDFPTNPKCLILIQGTGVVRLGQWARSVCINENLNIGTMIPYVNKAIENKFSVIILNPNERKDFKTEKIIPEFNLMEKHSVYVYNNIIKTNDNIKEIYIVAHSMGGECTVDIFRKISRNYVGSNKPCGTFVRSYETSYGGVDCYSSGHTKHEYTSGFAIDEIFKYFNEKDNDNENNK